MMNIYFVKAGKSETETFTQAFHIVNLIKTKIWKISKTKTKKKKTKQKNKGKSKKL